MMRNGDFYLSYMLNLPSQNNRSPNLGATTRQHTTANTLNTPYDEGSGQAQSSNQSSITFIATHTAPTAP
jgi:hypothetical protein